MADSSGKRVAELSEYIGHRSNNVAEYSGLLGALQYCLKHKEPALKVISDSELMVKQLNGDYAVKAEHLKPLHEEARGLLKHFSEIEIRHIPREENAQADAMSNRAIDERL